LSFFGCAAFRRAAAHSHAPRSMGLVKRAVGIVTLVGERARSRVLTGGEVRSRGLRPLARATPLFLGREERSLALAKSLASLGRSASLAGHVGRLSDWWTHFAQRGARFAFLVCTVVCSAGVQTCANLTLQTRDPVWSHGAMEPRTRSTTFVGGQP